MKISPVQAMCFVGGHESYYTRISYYEFQLVGKTLSEAGFSLRICKFWLKPIESLTIYPRPKEIWQLKLVLLPTHHLCLSEIKTIFALAILDRKQMKTREDYIQLLHSSEKELTRRFGIRTVRLFGSVARGQHTVASDVDICVETETTNPFLLVELKEYLENLFNCPVDVVRYRPNMNPYLKRQIEKEKKEYMCYDKELALFDIRSRQHCQSSKL